MCRLSSTDNTKIITFKCKRVEKLISLYLAVAPFCSFNFFSYFVIKKIDNKITRIKENTL